MTKLFNKKALSVLVAAVLLLITVIPAFAADAFTVTETAEVQGSTVVVKLYLPENTNLGTLSLNISYDPALFSFASAEYASGDVTSTNSKTAGEVGLNAVWNETAPSGGLLVTVTFNINDDSVGSSLFLTTVNFATDANNQNITLTAESAKVELTSAPAETTAADSDAGKADVKAGGIPKTSGRYVAIGSAAAVVAAAAVVTAVTLKRKKK